MASYNELYVREDDIEDEERQVLNTEQINAASTNNGEGLEGSRLSLGCRAETVIRIPDAGSGPEGPSS